MAVAVAAQGDLPVDLMEEIFLRLDDAGDLIRASATCASFHRLIFDGRFLRRFRSLHRPPVLGLLLDCYASDRAFSFYPAEPPRRFALAARGLAQAADFSILSLSDPTNNNWWVRDVLDGRVLLSECDGLLNSWYVFEYLVVYDPLHHRRVQIPAIPGDLLARTERGGPSRWLEFDPFLVPAAADKEVKDEDDLSFRVMCNVVSDQKDVDTFIYTSVTGEWHGVASCSIAYYEPMESPRSLQRHYAHGCFYWINHCEALDMLVFNMSEMKFSIVNLPPESKGRQKIVVEATKDRLGLLILGENKLDLYTKPLQNNGIGGKGDDWRHDNMTPLLDGYQWFFNAVGGVAEGYALLRGVPRDECQVWQRCPMKQPPNAHCFTAELKTLLVEHLCVLEHHGNPNFLYARFPPPFGLPSI